MRPVAICLLTSGLPLQYTPHERETIYVVPIKSDLEHYPPDRECAPAPTAAGRAGMIGSLSQQDYRKAIVTSMCCAAPWQSTYAFFIAGEYFGTTGGQVYTSADAGDRWSPLVLNYPPVSFRRSSDIAMMRVVLPQHLQVLANVNREIELQVEGPSSCVGSVGSIGKDCYPMLRGTLRDQVTLERRPFIRFFALR